MAGRINGFNTVARVYDALAWLVYGNAVLKSQTYFLGDISGADRVLILGGGTGRVAAHLLRENTRCRLWYVEASSAMIARARSRLRPFHDRIHFIHGTEDDIPGRQFDAVIVPFVFDLFSARRCSHIVSRIKASARRHSLWLVTDFVSHDKWWENALLRAMYVLFRLAAGIEANKLPDWQGVLAEGGCTPRATRDFYHRFIRSALFEVREE